MDLELGLVVHGNNGCHERSGYENMLAHCRQVKELTVVEGQFGILELMLCRRASNGDFSDVS